MPTHIKSDLLIAINILPLFLLCLIACENKSNVNTIGETELYFDEKLASLSSGSGGTVWIGGENGNIWRVKGNNSTSFDVGEGRVYKVLETEGKEDRRASLWIGVRNSGLQQWEMKGDSLGKLKTYSIPLKHDQYSPYDMVRIHNSMYVATTQGLYQLSLLASSDSMRLVYPAQEVLEQNYDHSFIVHNLFNYKDSILWAATEKGALRLNINNGEVKMIYPDLPISHVSVYNDTLFILSDNTLYLNQVGGVPLGKVKLPFSPKVYYQEAGTHYMADRDNILLSNDLKNFQLMPLRRKISDKCRNMILPDPKNDFVLLLMEDALWRIPNHTGVFKGNSPVKAACGGEHQAYYLTSENELYYQQGDAPTASPIYSFPKEEQIVWMRALGEKLFYYNTKQEVKEFTASPFLLKNLLFHSPRTLYQSKHKITAACLRGSADNPSIYLGVQDGLLLLDTKQRVDTVADFAHRYVTSFFAPAHSDMLYLSTLNSGMFYGTSSTQFKSISDTLLHPSAKDLIITGDYPPRLISLTNHHILLQGSIDTIPARGCDRLLYVNDTLFYALSESGIRKISIDNKGCLQDRGCFYTDIRFNRAAAFVRGQRLYLGSNLGVLTINTDKKQNTEWISFQPNTIIRLKYILVLILFVGLLMVWVVFRYVRRKHAGKKRVIKRITYLKVCVEELISFYNLSDDAERHSIEQLKAGIDNLQIDTTNRKELNHLIGQFTEEIIQRNRKATLKLLDRLEKQIGWIATTHAFECKRLLKESLETQKSNDIDRIKQQVSNNETWITEFTHLEKETKQMYERLDSCIKIEGVNAFIWQELNRITEEVGQKPLIELREALLTVKRAYDDLFSDKALTVILQFITQTEAYLNDRKEPDVVSSLLLKRLKEISQHTTSEERILLLQQLGLLDKRVEFLRIKDRIADCVETYMWQREQIVDRNERLINKKFDKELESDIARETKECVEKLERLIVSMYRLLGVTDPVVLVDLLKISNSYHQQAKVLALLIAHPRIKRSLIPGMLGIYGNLNPVISRLVNNKIKANEEILKAYMEEDPLQATFVHYILKLIE